MDSGIIADNVNEAVVDIIENSGAILPSRDAVDNRIISQYSNTSALIIDSQSQVGGFPVLNSEAALLDSDNDGMPDSWEIANSLDLNNPNDRNVLNEEGYTNLEEYINGSNFALSTTDVAVNDTKKSFKVYHDFGNPRILNIDFQELQNISNFNVYSVTGSLLFNKKLQGNTGQKVNLKLNMSDFSSGLYLLSVTSNQKTQTKKIILY